jgi:predicted N-acetyltransferase YhbS
LQSEITNKSLLLDELSKNFLTEFKRYQKTSRVLAKSKHCLTEKADYFIDDWNDEKKAYIIKELRQCVQSGGAVIGAFYEGKLVGFANVASVRFGENLDYVELPYIHVSNESRGSGVGKSLFYLCCEKAKQLGAKKLYIGTHPSVETQKFYKTVGCTLAKEINEDVYNREPLDIQLEYILI